MKKYVGKQNNNPNSNRSPIWVLFMVCPEYLAYPNFPAAVVGIGKACGTLLKFGQLIDTDQRPLGCEIYL